MNWVELRGKPNKRENCGGSKLKNVEEAILSGSWVFIKYSMDHEDFVLTLRCWIIVFNWKRFRFPSECDGSKQSKQTTRSSQLNYIFFSQAHTCRRLLKRCSATHQQSLGIVWGCKHLECSTAGIKRLRRNDLSWWVSDRLIGWWQKFHLLSGEWWESCRGILNVVID